MRLFIAIDFDEHKDYFQQLQQSIADLGIYGFPKSFHLTLKFLGELADSKVDEVKSSLADLEFQAFKLTLEKLGVFPSEKYVRVLWVGVRPVDPVNVLQQQVEARLTDFPKDKRFHPHITLARVKLIKDKARFAELLRTEVESRSTAVDSFHLIKSTLTSQGPIYEKISSFAAVRSPSQ